MKHRLIGCAALLTALTIACQAQPALKTDKIALAPGLQISLPTLDSLNRHVEVVQNVVARYGSRTIAFEGRIDAAPDHFTLVCSDGMGRRAVTVNWTDKGISYEAAPWVPAELRPENMLADLVLIYWPQAALMQAIPDAAITTTASGRNVTVAGHDVARIDYTPQGGDIWFGKSVYQNKLWNYSFTIESAALEP